MYSISTSSAIKRLSVFRAGCISARTPTRNATPPGLALKRCSKRRRGDTVARRNCTSAAASSGVPSAEAYKACAALTLGASAMNCSLIKSHISRRLAAVAPAYQAVSVAALRPPSTSLTLPSTTACSSCSTRRNARGDNASSLWARVACKRSRVERGAAAFEAAPSLIAACANPAGAAGTFPLETRGVQRATLRLIQESWFMPTTCFSGCGPTAAGLRAGAAGGCAWRHPPHLHRAP